MFGYWEAGKINLSRKVSASAQNLVGVLKNLIHIFSKPSFDECGFLLAELFILECDTYIFENIKRNEALSWPIATSVLNYVLDWCGPASICRMQSYISQRHAKPLKDCFMVEGCVLLTRLGKQPEDFVSELQHVCIFFCKLIEISIKFLIESLRTNEVLLE